MFLIQVCLHNEGIRNWHTFLGFMMEYLLAIVAATQKIGFRSAIALFRHQNKIEACGFQPSPRTYCAARSGTEGLQINFFPHPLLYKMVFLVVDSITVLVLLVDQLMWTLRRHHKTRHLKFGSWRPGRGPKGKFKREWNIFRKWFWRMLEVVYLCVNVLYLVSLIKVIDGESFAANRWAYGQIIAMTVWGPVIVKLFDLILCKSTPASKSPLPPEIQDLICFPSWTAKERRSTELGPAAFEDRQHPQSTTRHHRRRRARPRTGP